MADAGIIIPDSTLDSDFDAPPSISPQARPAPSPRKTIRGTEGADILFGTSGNDDILGLGGDDTIYGTPGADTMDGGAGFDTVDYRFVGKPITLLPRGGLNGDSMLGSQLKSIEAIYGAANQLNTVNASTATGATLSVKFGSEEFANVTVSVPGVLSQSFRLKNFTRFIGTAGNDSFDATATSKNIIFRGREGDDTLLGGSGNDRLVGGSGSDRIQGGAGDDWINGSSARDKGVNERDQLTGDAPGSARGSDRFILGTKNNAYYLDSPKGSGDTSFATLTDFGLGDVIELAANQSYRTIDTETGFIIEAVQTLSDGVFFDKVADVTVEVPSFAATARGASGQATLKSTRDSLLASVPDTFTLSPGQQLGGFVAAA